MVYRSWMQLVVNYRSLELCVGKLNFVVVVLVFKTADVVVELLVRAGFVALEQVHHKIMRSFTTGIECFD